MNTSDTQALTKAALEASWNRCERNYRLKRDATHPILRLQSAEVAPRHEALTHQIGGRHGIFRKLAAVAADAGQCLVMTDKDGILVRLDCKDDGANWNGIALGSVWDERVAGTNGVAMALSEGRDFTVRGQDHYYAQLNSFSCTAVPLRDAHNHVIGVVNLSAIDLGNPAELSFSRHLLGVAASRLQHTLFEQSFKDAAIVSVAVPGRRELIKGPELVAVDNDGNIIGATSDAHLMSQLPSHDALTGERFDMVFGTDMHSLDKVPGRVMSVRRDRGPMLDLWMRAPVDQVVRVPGWRQPTPTRKLRQRSPSLNELLASSPSLTNLIMRAQSSLAHGLPVLIEGATGTGKSALASALIHDASQKVTIDCATLDDTLDDRDYIQSMMQQVRIAHSSHSYGEERIALVFDNIHEMPPFAQTALRALLDEFEKTLCASGGAPLILATARNSLLAQVEAGTFRDDLYYLLSAAAVTLPPLRARSDIATLTDALTSTLTDCPVDISSAGRRVINAHPWPGNVRELVQALQRALIHGNGVRIGALDLGIDDTAHTVSTRLASSGPTLTEEQLLRDALHGARWNVSKAARQLNMGRATIHRKMKAYGITRPS